MKPNTLIIASIIFLLGIILRFYQLGSVPSSLNWDEVSWGYNAYSIATTGRDEHGAFLPLSFKAFGDYKQPMYVYLDVIPTLIFGLTGFAVRFPSALFGSLTILSVYLFASELFYKEKRKKFLSLLSMLLFAISPWSIQFSRVAFEANVGIFFTITGAWLFLRGLRTKQVVLLCLSAIVLSLSGFTYHSQKVFTPLLFLVFLFYGRNYFWNHKKILFFVLTTFFVVNIIWAADARTTNRGRSVMFTSNQTEVLKSSTQLLIDDKRNNDILGQIIHNRRIVYLETYLKNYLSHFSPNYLFIKGDNPRHHPPLMGNLYLVELPFILIGIVYLLKKRKDLALLLLPWFFLAPVASALAIDAPNASRSMVFLPTWQLFSAFGMVTVLSILSWKRRVVSIAVFALFLFLNIVYYLHNYFIHTDLLTAPSWQYGYKEAVQYASSLPSNRKAFFASDVEQPYIFYLFHSKIQPTEYIESGGSDRITKSCFSIRNSYFGKCIDLIKSGDIYISQYDATPKPVKLVKTILYPDQTSAMRISQFK